MNFLPPHHHSFAPPQASRFRPVPRQCVPRLLRMLQLHLVPASDLRFRGFFVYPSLSLSTKLSIKLNRFQFYIMSEKQVSPGSIFQNSRKHLGLISIFVNSFFFSVAN